MFNLQRRTAGWHREYNEIILHLLCNFKGKYLFPGIYLHCFSYEYSNSAYAQLNRESNTHLASRLPGHLRKRRFPRSAGWDKVIFPRLWPRRASFTRPLEGTSLYAGCSGRGASPDPEILFTLLPLQILFPSRGRANAAGPSRVQHAGERRAGPSPAASPATAHGRRRREAGRPPRGGFPLLPRRPGWGPRKGRGKVLAAERGSEAARRERGREGARRPPPRHHHHHQHPRPGPQPAEVCAGRGARRRESRPASRGGATPPCGGGSPALT